jgi:hypothetical protein
VAAVTLTAQNTSDAISDPALQFLSAEADKEYTRSQCLRHMNFQTVLVIAICLPAQTWIRREYLPRLRSSLFKIEQASKDNGSALASRISGAKYN